jgi:dienelactone hydrolase
MKVSWLDCHKMLRDLGSFADLEKVLDFSPPQLPNIDMAGLFTIFGRLPKFPDDFQIIRGKSWAHDGVQITELSWSTGFGPRTQALLLLPENATTPLPGALFLHSHDDVKEFGKEKLVDGAGKLPESLSWVKREHYGNRSAANELAKRGFAVLVFDCFMWGSRRFTLENMPARLKELFGKQDYELLAIAHESVVLAKYLSLFGATLAGLVNFDDRIAFEIAKTLPEISDSISTIGLSGGGARAIYLHATQPELKTVVSIGAMATYRSMLPEHISPHSWLIFPHGLAAKSDWPALCLINKATPLYVQFCGNDQLFTKAGMAEADAILQSAFESGGGQYRSGTYPVRHSFTVEMQEDAFDWLVENA